MPFRISRLCRGLHAPSGLIPGSRQALLAVALSLIASSAAGQVFETVGTRAQGMGGAFVAVADDATAVYWNPAGLATGATVDLQWDFQTRQRIEDPGQPLRPPKTASRGTSGLIALGVPALGVSYYRLRAASASADSTTVAAPGGRETESGWGLRLDALTTHNVGVSVLQSVAHWAVIGATVRVVRGVAARGTASGVELPGEALDVAEALEGPARTTVDLDAGAMASLGVVRVGIVARNLREPVFGAGAGSDGLTLRRQIRLGMAIVPRSRPTGIHGPFTVSVDVDLTSNDGPEGKRRDVAAGVERWWGGGRVAARAGVRGSTLEPRRPVGAVGFSVAVRPSTFVEGQLTRGRAGSEGSWGMAARVTF